MAREPLAVLLLSRHLDAAAQQRVTELLRAPGVVALEPGPVAPDSLARMPARLVARHARGQARRLARRLPGRPVAVVVVDAFQRPRADALAQRVDGCVVVEDSDDTEGLRARLRGRGVRVD